MQRAYFLAPIAIALAFLPTFLIWPFAVPYVGLMCVLCALILLGFALPRTRRVALRAQMDAAPRICRKPNLDAYNQQRAFRHVEPALVR